jgi:hypothetical protein
MMWHIAADFLIATTVFWGWWIFTEAQDRRYRNRMWCQYWDRKK